ncbi:hypothetical protein T11_7122 [Trichinella zimbabwensis]|uniref:Uncharacterized protein n=1 Tax=Trichinella zimbabwensis TaxID=268475 RepID=A0A0V1H2L4_9BILA|nr:hypothetical protein T11_7122 [Trichinella zimbabwensis]
MWNQNQMGTTLAKQCKAETVIMVYGGRWSTLKFNCSKIAGREEEASRHASMHASRQEGREEEELYKWGGARLKKPRDKIPWRYGHRGMNRIPSRIHCPMMKAILDQLDHLDRQNTAAHPDEI